MGQNMALTLYLLLMKDRIKQIMESQHMTQQAFSQFTGISSSVLSGIFTGRTKPTLNQVEAIRRKIPNIDLDWLLTGVGSMYKTEGQPHNTPADSLPPTLAGESDSKNDSQGSAKRTVGVAVKGINLNNDVTAKKNLDISKRKITEIRVFYDDNTYEAFVPKNS